MDFSKFNDHYKNDPPLLTFDDIGIFSPVEVPLPSKYTKSPCLCGTIHKWEFPETFYIDEIKIFLHRDDKKKIKKCKTCNEILTLELYKD